MRDQVLFVSLLSLLRLAGINLTASSIFLYELDNYYLSYLIIPPYSQLAFDAYFTSAYSTIIFAIIGPAMVIASLFVNRVTVLNQY